MIGTSTGGPQALTTVFSNFPVIPRTACLIVQHMPKGFTANLAKRLDQLSAWSIQEAGDNEVIYPGVAYVAPGGFQMRLNTGINEQSLSVRPDGLVNGHQPSVDALFLSVANVWKKTIVGVLMTGMGKDGAQGLKEIRNNGGYTIAQEAESCVVYGMPKAAVAIGAAMITAPLSDISSVVVHGWKSIVQLKDQIGRE